MVSARRPSSQKLYESYLAKWKKFANHFGFNELRPTIVQGIKFLNFLYKEGLGYSALNTARSALSAYLIFPEGISFGTHKDVSLFLKGIWNLKTPTPRYVATWDTADVLKFLETWSPAYNLSLEKLTMKLIILILLTTGQRPQVITKLDLVNMNKTDQAYRFYLNSQDIKQGRPGFKPQLVELLHYPHNQKICVYFYMKEYIERTALLRNKATKLFITAKKPHRPVSADTVSRWIKQVLTLAGVDTETYKAGSTRAASVSKAKEAGLPMEKILQAGGWTRTSTFNTYYNKSIENVSFAQAILSCSSSSWPSCCCSSA